MGTSRITELLGLWPRWLGSLHHRLILLQNSVLHWPSLTDDTVNGPEEHTQL